MGHIMKQVPEVCGSLTTTPQEISPFYHMSSMSSWQIYEGVESKPSYTRSTLFGHRLHVDTTDVIRSATSDGFKRALFIVDDASRWVFVTLQRTASMDETVNAFHQVLQILVSDSRVLRTQIVRTDNGTEFINSTMHDLFAEVGITHERSYPNTSHQNDVVKCVIGRIMTTVRTIMTAVLSLELPTLWGEALHAATHVINHIQCTSNPSNTSPYQPFTTMGHNDVHVTNSVSK